MFARVTLDISAQFIIQTVKDNIKLEGFKVGRFWHDDNDFIIHIEMPKVGDVKVKFRVVSHRNTFLGFDIRRVVVSKALPISGKAITIVMKLFKSIIERTMPFANIKVKNNIIYLENIKTDRIQLHNGNITGELFLSK